MNWLIIVLRLIHIVFGIFWAGSMFFLASFLLPTARAAGPAGAPFMRRFAQSAFPNALAGSAVLTVLSGLWLMWTASGGDSAWFGSPTGITLSIGGLASIIALGFGLAVQRPATLRLGVIGASIDAAGGTPTAEQAAEVGVLQAKTVRGVRLLTWLLTVAVVCMAIARYV